MIQRDGKGDTREREVQCNQQQGPWPLYGSVLHLLVHSDVQQKIMGKVHLALCELYSFEATG